MMGDLSKVVRRRNAKQRVVLEAERQWLRRVSWGMSVVMQLSSRLLDIPDLSLLNPADREGLETILRLTDGQVVELFGVEGYHTLTNVLGRMNLRRAYRCE
jgi:hypothetical protein